MKTYFEVSVKFQTDEGKPKTETYLFEAVNHGDAEACAIKELADELGEELSVKAVKSAKYSEIIFDNHFLFAYWYKVKVMFTDENEKTTSELILVWADKPIRAYELAAEKLKNVIMDWRIVSITETKIKDVILLQP